MKLFRVLGKMVDEDDDYLFSIAVCAAVVIVASVVVLASFIGFKTTFNILAAIIVAGFCAPAIIGVVKYWNKVD